MALLAKILNHLLNLGKVGGGCLDHKFLLFNGWQVQFSKPLSRMRKSFKSYFLNVLS